MYCELFQHGEDEFVWNGGLNIRLPSTVGWE